MLYVPNLKYILLIGSFPLELHFPTLEIFYFNSVRLMTDLVKGFLLRARYVSPW